MVVEQYAKYLVDGCRFVVGAIYHVVVLRGPQLVGWRLELVAVVDFGSDDLGGSYFHSSKYSNVVREREIGEQTLLNS